MRRYIKIILDLGMNNKKFFEKKGQNMSDNLENEFDNSPEDFEGPDQISLTLDDGTELICDVVAIFPAGDKTYIALLPNRVIEGYEEDEVFLYRYKELEGDDVDLIPIEDEAEYELASEAFDDVLDEFLDEEEFNNM